MKFRIQAKLFIEQTVTVKVNYQFVHVIFFNVLIQTHGILMSYVTT